MCYELWPYVCYQLHQYFMQCDTLFRKKMCPIWVAIVLYFVFDVGPEQRKIISVSIFSTECSFTKQVNDIICKLIQLFRFGKLLKRKCTKIPFEIGRADIEPD